MKPCAMSALFALTLAACASEPAPQYVTAPRETLGPRPGEPTAIERVLPTFDEVVAHQDALALDDAQRDLLIADSVRIQAELVALEWRLGAAHEALARTLESTSAVDEASTLAAARDVVALEGEIKLVQLGLRIRLRNALRDEQRQRLEEIRAR